MPSRSCVSTRSATSWSRWTSRRPSGLLERRGGGTRRSRRRRRGFAPPSRTTSGPAVFSDDAAAACELAGDDAAFAEEAERTAAELTALLDQLEIESWFSGEFDEGDAILTVNPGQGGLEAQDGPACSYQMYVHYAEDQGLEGDGARSRARRGHRARSGHDPDRGPLRLRLAAQRDRHPPPRAHQPHRRQEASPDHLRLGGGAAGHRRRHRGRLDTPPTCGWECTAPAARGGQVREQPPDSAVAPYPRAHEHRGDLPERDETSCRT